MDPTNIELVAENLQGNMNLLWVAICAALVFFMQAGFAMLESGMVRSKNSINVIMKTTPTCVSVLWFSGPLVTVSCSVLLLIHGDCLEPVTSW